MANEKVIMLIEAKIQAQRRAELVEASQSAAREAGNHLSVGPLAKPLSTAALHQEEEEVASRSCAQELHAPLQGQAPCLNDAPDFSMGYER